MKRSVLAPLSLTLLLSSMAVHAAEHVVEMKNNGADGMMVFEPSVIKVAVGDTVKFVPTDMAHNSQSVDGLTPVGSATWQGVMNQEVSVTLDKEGVYVYQCAPHSIMAMVGVVVAGNPVNLDQIKADSKKLTSTFVMNKDRLDNYLAGIK